MKEKTIEEVYSFITGEWQTTAQITKAAKKYFYLCQIAMEKLLQDNKIEKQTLGRITYWRRK